MVAKPTGEGPVLKLNGIKKSFGGIHVLKGIDLEVERGSIQGLIGPNGSGKSTLFDLITGYQKPDEGSVEFKGEEIQGMAPHKVSRSGLIRTFQLTKIFPNLTVAENLLVFASADERQTKKEAEDRAVELMDFVHLIGLHDREASTLSYGQLKLLEFAQVLMHRPEMLMLDEPFAGVNPGLIEELVSHIRTMRDRGLTILLVEHNLPIVAELCDRVAVVSGGQISMNEVPEVVVNDPGVKEVFLGES
ncbi:ABC transporter ATP-binding protein [Leucobacter celer]|uniref:ABC transporter ATP-binding protein n=1 Tax=Leucobacter celer TaxID=668625 RepID=UPI0006A76C63|nr:ABC transporter ATP-binding protein [Leucobacter celer]